MLRTLLVGDEPRDIVFAGRKAMRAFITTARRGQQRSHASLNGVPGAGDARATTPGLPRADVWVFDVASTGAGVGGRPLAIVELFGDTPRALAVSADNKTVYAAVFHSGNRSTTLHERMICPGFERDKACMIGGVVPAPGGQLGPKSNVEGTQAPEVGLIVHYDEKSGRWRDAAERDWSTFVRFSLPDKDVFAIDAETLQERAAYRGVGTTLFNMIAHPSNGRLYVSNTEARNDIRFEGPGKHGGSTVQGHIAEARITVIDGAKVLPRHLNSHLDYTKLVTDPAFERDAKRRSLATPLEMVISGNGQWLYVAAYGSRQVARFAVADLDSGNVSPGATHIRISGGGPAGLVLDEARNRLYVWTRFDNGLSVVDLGSGKEIDHLTYPSPEPANVIAGRRFLYDALATSANGKASCASCHIFADSDHLAWDLGNPDGKVSENPIPIENPNAVFILRSAVNGSGELRSFHPMKGPMMTQTLKGIATSGAMHWRGDRANGIFGKDANDSRLAFRNFMVAFEGLLGRAKYISDRRMELFADFALSLALPPNPNRPLDNGLSELQARGSDFFHNSVVDGPRTCAGCHTVNAASGLFGTSTTATVDGPSQILKVAHLRNLYQKVGMFGMLARIGGGSARQGPQVRGYGYSHDGSIDTLFRFTSGRVFNFPNDESKRQVAQYLLAFDTDLAPIVGQQVTLGADNIDAASIRVALLQARARAPFTSKILGGATTECDLIVKGVVAGNPRGWMMLADGRFRSDTGDVIGAAALRDLARNAGPLTYICVPPGWGRRMGIDRDSDGHLDALDNCPAAANGDQADICDSGE